MSFLDTLPLWQKAPVHATRIMAIDVEPDAVRVLLEHGGVLHLNRGFLAVHNPAPGGYLIFNDEGIDTYQEAEDFTSCMERRSSDADIEHLVNAELARIEAEEASLYTPN